MGVRKEGNCPRLFGCGQGNDGLLLRPERSLGVGICLGNRGTPTSAAPAGGCLFIVRFGRDATWAASLALNLDVEIIKIQIFRVADAKLALCARSMAGCRRGCRKVFCRSEFAPGSGRAMLGEQALLRGKLVRAKPKRALAEMVKQKAKTCLQTRLLIKL